MAFRIFRLIVGAVVGALVAYMVYTGVSQILRGPELRMPVIQLILAAVVVAVFYFSLVAGTRIRRILENMFAIPELIRKIGFTLLLLCICRIGFYIPVPGLDQAKMLNMRQRSQDQPIGKVLETVAIFTGGDLQQSMLFGLGIMPYITAAIIFQLLGTVVPSIERLQKEGDAGRRKIQEYTRYATVLLCIVQGTFWMTQLRSNGALYDEYAGPLTYFMGVLGMTTGTIFMMWLGEQVDEYGIGNGISLIIMSGIVARMPNAVVQLLNNATLSVGGAEDKIGPIRILVLACSFVFVVAGSILITQGQRRIPVQQAKQTRGRRIYGGQRQYLPLRVNHGGVMPIIFASSLILFPYILFSAVGSRWQNRFTLFLANEFTSGQYLYEMLYIAMIFFFAYFWTTVIFRPKDMAENLRDAGHFIPGLRPGKRTADYLERVMERITYCGAAFLSLIAVIPSVVTSWMKIPYSVSAFLGGTGLLITVSVTLDLVQRIESQLVMRNYGGFLGEGGGRIKGSYT